MAIREFVQTIERIVIQHRSSKMHMAVRKCVFLCATLVLTCSAVAQESSNEKNVDGLQEIIVTAQKREQDIQSVGISVAAFSGEQLRDLGINATAQLGSQTPGLMVADYNNPATTTFSVRGVSQIDFADHEESPVAVFVDGAYVPYLSGVGMSMFDLDRIEVLRGPQGTLFGRNATGGAVQLITTKPGKDFDAYVDVTDGQYGLVETALAVGGPLTDNVQARVAFASTKHDGIFVNDAGPNKGDADSQNFRAQLRFQPSDTTDVLLSLHGSQDRESSVPYVPIPIYINPKTGLAVSGNPAAHNQFCQNYFGTTGMANSVGCLDNVPYTGNPYQISENQNGVGFRRDDAGATATVTWNLGTTNLTSVTNYEHFQKNYGPEDDDGTPLSSFDFGQMVHAWNGSQEFRLAGSSDRDRWVGGLYYLVIDGDYGVTTSIYQQAPPIGESLAVDNSYSLRDNTWAVFGQNEFDFRPDLTLTTGLRWTQDRKRFALYTGCNGPGCEVFGYDSPDIVQGTGYNDSVPGAQTIRDQGNWSGKLQLDWRPRDQALLYAGITRGTKAGGYNAQSTATWTVQQEIFKDEVLTDYEVGFKTTEFNNRVRVNGSAFYYHYSDLQVFSQAGASVFTFNTNAIVRGAELEVSTTPLHGMQIDLGVSWLNSLTDPIQNVNALNDNVLYVREQLPFSPPFSVNALIRQEWRVFAGTFSLQADAKWLDTHKVELLDDPALLVAPYAVANIRAAYETKDRHWKVSVFVNNVFNNIHLINGTNVGSVDGSVLGIYGPPRWFGGEVAYHW
jgi:iron complex outermembrane recepter protein